MKKGIIKRLLVFIILVTLCAAGMPSQRVQAESKDGLDTPVISKIKNVYRGVKITWNKVEEADYYRVYRMRSYESEWTNLGDTENQEYLDTSAGQGISVSYKIRAFSNDGSMSPTSGAQAIIRIPKPIYTLKAVSGGVKLDPFQINCSITGIIVYRKAPGESAYTRIAKVKGKYYTDTDAAEGGTYSYKVCTYKSGSKSPMSKEMTITLLGKPKLSLKKTEKSVKLSWTEVPGAEGYEIGRKMSEDSIGCSLYADTTDTYYTDKKSLDYPDWIFKVRAYYYNGSKKVYGPYSNGKTVG